VLFRSSSNHNDITITTQQHENTRSTFVPNHSINVKNTSQPVSVESSSQPLAEQLPTTSSTSTENVVGKPAFIAARSAGTFNEDDDDLVEVDNDDQREGEQEDHSEEENGDEEEVQWITEHESIGMNVMALFSVKKNLKRKKFQGKVTRFLPESRRGAKDELYHIVWEDNDECDYNTQEFKAGRKMYASTFPTGSSEGPGSKVENVRLSKGRMKQHHVLISQAPILQGEVPDQHAGKGEVDEDEDDEGEDDSMNL
jgi:hypothetical protein